MIDPEFVPLAAVVGLYFAVMTIPVARAELDAH